MEKCYMLCNAHIDPVWQWQWEEGVGACLSTFRAAADFCEEDNNLIFNHNEAILYEWTEKYDKPLFDRICNLVKSGRWHIMGGWYLQPDCTMPNGESIARQIKIGQDYFKEKFNVKPTVAVNVDSFGHSKGLVQLMVNAGYKGYLCMRPEGEMHIRDSVWKGNNNTEILVNRCMDAYNSVLYGARKKVEDFLVKQAHRDIGLILWGVGNHGGGPSRRDIKELNELIESRHGDVKIIHATTEQYFDELSLQKDTLPIVKGDLNYYNQGCYTSQIRLKQLHSKLENELFKAEKMATIASLMCNMEYPFKEIALAEKDLLFGEFHDVLPGSSIASAEEDGIRLFNHGLEETSRICMQSFFALSAHQPKCKDGEYPLIVFNPHPYDITATIDCEVMLADGNWSDNIFIPHIFDENGVEIECQSEKESSNMPLDWRKRIIFNAFLKAGSISRYSCYFKQDGRFYSKYIEQEVENKIILKTNNENLQEAICLEVNSKTGLIDNYIIGNKRYLISESCKVEVYEDTHDSWGTLFNNFNNKLGEFELLDSLSAASFAGIKKNWKVDNSGEKNQQLKLAPLRIIEDGKIRTVVEGLFGYNSSRLVMRYIFDKNTGEFSIKIKVNNNEKDIKLKLKINTAQQKAKYTGSSMFDISELPINSTEVVAQDYVMLSDGNNGIGVINFGNYGSNCDGSSIGITLLRSAAYSSYAINDKALKEDRFSQRMDIGERDFNFVIYAGSESELKQNIAFKSIVAHQKPYVMNYFPSGIGSAPKTLCKIDNTAIMLSMLCAREYKRDNIRHENNNYVALRLFNSTKCNQITHVCFKDIVKEINFNGLEFKTFLIKGNELIETNILEE